MHCAWEGNRRFGIALATCHTVTDISGSPLQAQGLREGDEQVPFLAYAVLWSMVDFISFLTSLLFDQQCESIEGIKSYVLAT